jgi:hypothetical protein
MVGQLLTSSANQERFILHLTSVIWAIRFSTVCVRVANSRIRVVVWFFVLTVCQSLAFLQNNYQLNEFQEVAAKAFFFLTARCCCCLLHSCGYDVIKTLT